MASNVETRKSTKDKESKWVENYQYFFKKPINKNGSMRYVCSYNGCSASVTILNNEIIKVNGKNIKEYSADLIKEGHKDNHEAISGSKIFEIDFKLTMKDAVEKQPGKPIGQVYQEQQNKIIEDLDTLEIIAEILPQLSEIESGLTKHKRRFLPKIPETIEEILIMDE